MYKLPELDNRNKAALERMRELGKEIYEINNKIAELARKREKLQFEFTAKLRCFPNARHIYFHGEQNV